MYITSIVLKDFRTFAAGRLDFVQREQKFDASFPRPKLANVNVLLGDNGAGKTSVLRAIALAGLGPVVADAGIFPNSLVRKTRRRTADSASVSAEFLRHDQDGGAPGPLTSVVSILRREDVEQLRWGGTSEIGWEAIYKQRNDAFFMVGYGATRRVERPESFNLGAMLKSRSPRAQRVLGLFEDSYALIPLGVWLPELKSSNPGRYSQVLTLLNKVLIGSDYKFTAELDGGDYLFERRGGASIGFQSLSDGYRALIGWVADLLYHVCMTCPSGKKLVDNRGIAMVDEVDLHLHPGWQMRIVGSLARALPMIQFIFTSHSPLVVGSLEWMNVIVMRKHGAGVRAERITQAIHGLDADQLLLTDLFGLESTRAPTKARELKALGEKARDGDADAALAVLRQMSKGTETIG